MGRGLKATSLVLAWASDTISSDCSESFSYVNCHTADSISHWRHISTSLPSTSAALATVFVKPTLWPLA